MLYQSKLGPWQIWCIGREEYRIWSMEHLNIDKYKNFMETTSIVINYTPHFK